MKSFDYDKNFGVYVASEVGEDDNDSNTNKNKPQGFIFSVSHQLIVPMKELRIGEGSLINLGRDLRIGNDCCDEDSCSCDYNHAGVNYMHISGARRFQLEEIEAFVIVITTTME
jgi:hypothetical protein